MTSLLMVRASQAAFPHTAKYKHTIDRCIHNMYVSTVIIPAQKCIQFEDKSAQVVANTLAGSVPLSLTRPKSLVISCSFVELSSMPVLGGPETAPVICRDNDLSKRN